MHCAWPGKINVHAPAITFVPVATFCMVLQLPAPGTNVIARACTFNLPGQAQCMPWARCDRPGVNVIAPAFYRLDWNCWLQCPQTISVSWWTVFVFWDNVCLIAAGDRLVIRMIAKSELFSVFTFDMIIVVHTTHHPTQDTGTLLLPERVVLGAEIL